MTTFILCALNFKTEFGIEKEEGEGGGCVFWPTHWQFLRRTRGGKTASVITWSRVGRGILGWRHKRRVNDLRVGGEAGARPGSHLHYWIMNGDRKWGLRGSAVDADSVSVINRNPANVSRSIFLETRRVKSLQGISRERKENIWSLMCPKCCRSLPIDQSLNCTWCKIHTKKCLL